MRHPSDSDPRDALNDYLDTLAGVTPATPAAGPLDPELRDDVDRFFDLAERAGMVPGERRRPTMNATLPASTTIPSPSVPSRRNIRLPAWTRHLHLASTGLLIAVVIALSIVAYGPNGIGNGNNGTGSSGSGDGPSFNGAVPIATVPEGAKTSSIPYPTADECTVAPLTRQEIIDRAVAGTEEPGYAVSTYDHLTDASLDQASEIMAAFREYQACSMKGQTYALAMMTPFGVVGHLGIPELPGDGTPVTVDSITARVDTLVTGPSDTQRTPAPTIPSANMPSVTGVPTTPLPPGVNEMGTPVTVQPTMSPVSGGASPEFILTMFPADIQMIDENNAQAVAYWVDPDTREVQYFAPRVLRMTRVDGSWLVDGERDGLGQG